jgi:hypothetical protein
MTSSMLYRAVIDVRLGSFSETVELEVGESLTVGRDESGATSTHRITVPVDELPPLPVAIPFEAMRFVLYPDPETAPRLLATLSTNNRDSWALRSGSNMVRPARWLELHGGDTLELMRLLPAPRGATPVLVARVLGEFPKRPIAIAPPTTIDPHEWAWHETMRGLRVRLFPDHHEAGPGAWRQEGFALLVDMVADEHPATREEVFRAATLGWSGDEKGAQTLARASWVLGRCRVAWAESIPADWSEVLGFDAVVTGLPKERALRALGEKLRAWGVITEQHLEVARAAIEKSAEGSR